MMRGQGKRKPCPAGSATPAGGFRQASGRGSGDGEGVAALAVAIADAKDREPDRGDIERHPGALVEAEENGDHREEGEDPQLVTGAPGMRKLTAFASPRATARR